MDGGVVSGCLVDTSETFHWPSALLCQSQSCLSVAVLATPLHTEILGLNVNLHRYLRIACVCVCVRVRVRVPVPVRACVCVCVCVCV